MQDITNSIIKIVSSLSQKKYRVEHSCFAAEGTKCVRSTWDSFNCRWLIATKSWYEQFGNASHYDKMLIASKGQMARMSQFSTPADVIAIYELPNYEIDKKELLEGLTLILDNVQDPGNLGTIIRIADWYGIKNIICSDTTADLYSHKVIQATMGAIANVKVHYVDLVNFLSEDWKLPVFGTFLDGKNIYTTDLPQKGFVIMGNEGKGISPHVAEFVTHRLTIPATKGDYVSDSLNVGVATAIVVSEFRRNIFK
ncbi:MAG: RNA methyltransferase [Muribaculaceae bacterium]|nr:RNA methyltransferase [Muribaculaceae bacterium]